MSTAHKIAITAVVLFVALSTAPAAAAADVGPNDLSKWDEVFNETDGDQDFSGSNVDAFDKLYINETGEEIRFAVQVDSGTGFDENNNALQVYIDADGETGITSEAGSDTGTPSWADFYDGLGAMNAEYRISKSSGFSAKIQEHDTDVIFNNIGDARYENAANTYRFGIDKATINDPEELDVKFAYAKDPAATSPDEFAWAPSNPIRVNDEGSAATASVEVRANFGRSDFDDGASAEFTLTDDGEEIVSQPVEDLSSQSVTESLSVSPNDFDGTVNASVTVNGDGNYSFERDVDNTVEIATSGLSGGNTYDKNAINISIIEPTVNFDNGNIADGATVDFTLTDEDGKETDRPVAATAPLTETFTVNPDNFNGTNSELTVDVTGDSDFPYNETKSVIVDPSDEQEYTFNASEIGHKVTLEPVPGNGTREITDTNEFTIGVEAESFDENGGKDIYSIVHVIDFDSENLKNDIDNISTDLNNNNAIVSESTVNDGTVTIVISDDNDGSPIVDNSSGSVGLYNVTFEFADGLQDNLDQGDNVTQFKPTTSDETVLYGSSTDTELNYKSSSSSLVKVDNDQIRITEAEITPLSEYGNMVGFTSRFEISVDTNEGDLGDITLNGNSSSSGPIDCDGESTCTKTVKYTPTKNTAVTGEGNYDENYEFEVVIEDNDGATLKTITQEDIDQDGNGITGDLNAKVYKKYDFNANGTEDGIDAGDVRSAIRELGEGNGEPWDESQGDLARLDVTGDGEISITDITTLVDKL
ncbi:hypothetical protein HKK80_02790 [Halonotius sp. F2-221B]|uniref:hypothetical protein n=1 Tax=Halonotius sp. F2-221B TaxID=2731620 RepID=UPI00398A830C